MENLGVNRVEPSFWAGRRVLLTGHTGFKGSWAALWLAKMGAAITGLSLPPETNPNLFRLAGVDRDIASHFCDLRNAEEVAAIAAAADPEIVLHMAAQPLVRRAIAQPVITFATNVLGTVHLLDALRACPSLRAVLVVTTDKVYENSENGLFFRETDMLGGHEPYGASKAAAEIVTAAMARTYFDPRGIAVVTARGGNVLGGGDFSEDRLVPDIVRAVGRGTKLVLRNPEAVRPWQYVLDCLAGYFCFLQAVETGKIEERTLNFGPEAGDVSVKAIAAAILAALGGEAAYDIDTSQSRQEAGVLNLDSRLARSALDWRDQFPAEACLAATAEWYLAWARGADMRATSLAAIDRFMAVQDKA